jgi:hypothetical protein
MVTPENHERPPRGRNAGSGTDGRNAGNTEDEDVMETRQTGTILFVEDMIK